MRISIWFLIAFIVQYITETTTATADKIPTVFIGVFVIGGLMCFMQDFLEIVRVK